jgi:hypothetical protein
VPFAHGRDEFQLLAKVPELLGINVLLRELEIDHGIAFRWAEASVHTNMPNAEPIVGEWLVEP